MPGSTSSRAAQVLDGLVRDQQRRPLFRRPGFRAEHELDPADEGQHELRTGDATGGAPGDDPGGSSTAPARRWDETVLPVPPVRRPRAALRVLVVGAVLAALVAGVAGRQFLARPAALDDRLPIASDEPAAAGTGSSSATTSDASGQVSATTGVTPTSASVATSGPVFVHVAGAVTAPGVVQLPGGSRVVDAVRAAGGLRPDADPDRVNLAAPLVDGSRVVVPALGQAPPTEVVTVPPAPGAGGVGAGDSSGGNGAVGTSGPIDLNTATLEQLDELPGVGPSTAQAILDHRGSEGPFTSVDSLLDVRGIGDAKLEAIRDLVTVG